MSFQDVGRGSSSRPQQNRRQQQQLQQPVGGSPARGGFSAAVAGGRGGQGGGFGSVAGSVGGLGGGGGGGGGEGGYEQVSDSIVQYQVRCNDIVGVVFVLEYESRLGGGWCMDDSNDIRPFEVFAL